MVVGTIWVHGQLQMASPGLDDDGDYGVVLPPGGIVCSIGSLERCYICRTEDSGSRWCGVVEIQRWTRFDGCAQADGVVWGRSDVDERWVWQDLCNDSS